MSKIITTINKLQNLISLTPATPNDIKNIEFSLSLTLADEYKEYILNYGAILADNTELTGFAKSKNRDVIQVTQREWSINNKIYHNMYVIENIGIDGIVIWQDSKGSIYESKPNYGASKIAESLEEYLNSKY